MRVEFFIPNWLKKRQLLYVTSHMFIIPLVDLFASGIDWKLSGAGFHNGLIWFFVVSYFNGIVLEFGRKIKPPEHEEVGVVSYTSLFGLKGGVFAWLLMVFITLLSAICAALYAGFDFVFIVPFLILFIVCTIPAALFLTSPSLKRAKGIELAAGIWTALMYLNLGAAPMIFQWFNS